MGKFIGIDEILQAEHQTVPHTPLRRRGRKGKHWPEPHWSIRWNCTAR